MSSPRVLDKVPLIASLPVLERVSNPRVLLNVPVIAPAVTVPAALSVSSPRVLESVPLIANLPLADNVSNPSVLDDAPEIANSPVLERDNKPSVLLRVPVPPCAPVADKVNKPRVLDSVPDIANVPAEDKVNNPSVDERLPVIPPPAADELPQNTLIKAIVYVVVGILKKKSAHSFGSVWSIPVTVITSPFISVAESVNNTATPLAGLTEGSVARFENPPPSMSTLKSPAAIVGAAFKLPATFISCKAILILKS